MNTTQSRYNILVIGKTGVGKSSFTNYLLGKNLAETGTGRPVTERGFHQYEDEVDGIPVTLYDSWGLEADKHKEWMENFKNELKERGVEKPASEWFHSVFYCISGGGHRVEDADIEILRLLNDARYPVSVILTKCDMLSEEQEKEMIAAIHKSNDSVHVIPMSSGGKNRSGIIEPFGREEIKKQAKEDFFISMAERIPDRLRSLLKKGLEDIEKKIYDIIDDMGMFDSEKDAHDKIKTAYDTAIQNIPTHLRLDLQKTLDAYAQSMELMDINITGMSHRYFEDNEINGFWEHLGMGVAIVVLGVPVILYQFLIGSDKEKEKVRSNFKKELDQDEKKLYAWIDDVERKLKEMRNKNISPRLAIALKKRD